jgi:hypothetical protein
MVTPPEFDNRPIRVTFDDTRGEEVTLDRVPRSLHERIKYWAESGKLYRWKIYQDACKKYGNSVGAVQRYVDENFPA